MTDCKHIYPQNVNGHGMSLVANYIYTLYMIVCVYRCAAHIIIWYTSLFMNFPFTALWGISTQTRVYHCCIRSRVAFTVNEDVLYLSQGKCHRWTTYLKTLPTIGPTWAAAETLGGSAIVSQSEHFTLGVLCHLALVWWNAILQ